MLRKMNFGVQVRPFCELLTLALRKVHALPFLLFSFFFFLNLVCFTSGALFVYEFKFFEF